MFSEIFPVNITYPVEWNNRNLIGGEDVVDSREINQVSLKMDLGHCSHPVIVGRDSVALTSLIMEETRCQVHYPEQNRDEGLMVTVVGQVTDVEFARSFIRKLLPLRITIHLPVRELFAFYPTVASPFIQNLQSQYSVRITDVRRPCGGKQGIVSMEGSDIPSLKEAYDELLDYYRKSSKSVQIFDKVYMMLHVSHHHLTIVQGKDQMNLNHIIRETCADIEFPCTRSFNNRSISIKGTFDNVLQAQSMLLGCVPLMMMFDVEGEADLDHLTIAKLVQKYDVHISVQQRRKPLTVNPFAILQKKKQSVMKTVFTVIGFEWNSENMYEVRKIILDNNNGNQEKLVPGLIPPTYRPFHNKK